MAAGQGFKNFSTGDVLTASDVNGYLMQGIWVFANAAARDAAVTSPQEGNSCYLKDTDVIQVYSGSSWVTKSGGSPLTTKGDLYTYSTTDTRLAIGTTNGHVLQVDSTAATGMKWAAAPSASAIWTYIGTSGNLNGLTTYTFNTLGAYSNFYLRVKDMSFSALASFFVRPNNQSTSATYEQYRVILYNASPFAIDASAGSTSSMSPGDIGTSASSGFGEVYIYGNKSSGKQLMRSTLAGAYVSNRALWFNSTIVDLAAAITSITIGGGTFGNGSTVELWGN